MGNQVDMPNPAAADLLALWRKCPHLGCLVPAPCESVVRYQCRCHQSTYNILGEKMFKGPAERGLDRFAVLIEDDGMIVIDTAQYTQGPPNLGPDHLSLHRSPPVGGDLRHGMTGSAARAIRRRSARESARCSAPARSRAG